MTLDERKAEFEKQVLVWIGIRDSFGCWESAAEFFRFSKETMLAHCIQNLKEKATELGITFSEPELE